MSNWSNKSHNRGPQTSRTVSGCAVSPVTDPERERERTRLWLFESSSSVGYGCRVRVVGDDGEVCGESEA